MSINTRISEKKSQTIHTIKIGIICFMLRRRSFGDLLGTEVFDNILFDKIENFSFVLFHLNNRMQILKETLYKNECVSFISVVQRPFFPFHYFFIFISFTHASSTTFVRLVVLH